VKNSSPERLLALALGIILVAAALGWYFAASPTPGPATSELRLPAGKPLLEPGRPDLRGDPGIADDEEQGIHPDE
jgi:hypothetical protein